MRVTTITANGLAMFSADQKTRKFINLNILEMKKETNKLPQNEALNIGVVTCRASFKGEMTKEHFYILLKYIDDMKLRGWVFDKHERKNGKNDTLEIDYVLVKYGR